MTAGNMSTTGKSAQTIRVNRILANFDSLSKAYFMKNEVKSNVKFDQIKKKRKRRRRDK